MPIKKCSKCGEEYDSMYSFHSCKEKNKKHRNKEDGIVKYAVKEVSGILWISVLFFVLPLLFLWFLLRFFD